VGKTIDMTSKNGQQAQNLIGGYVPRNRAERRHQKRVYIPTNRAALAGVIVGLAALFAGR